MHQPVLERAHAEASGFPKRDIRDQVEARLFRPDRLPMVTAVVMSADGAIYLRGFEYPRPDSVEWLVMRPAGEAGRFRTPARWRIVAAERNTVWIVSRDTLDAQRLTMFSVRPADR